MLMSASDEAYDPSLLDSRAVSVPHLFRDRVAADADRPAFLRAMPSRAPGADGADAEDWVPTTWAQARDLAYTWSAGLLTLGVELENSVGIAAGTSFDWVIADLAVMCAGAATTTIYPTTLAEDVAYIVADSGCVVVFAEDAAQVDKLRSQRDKLPELRHVVTFSDTPGASTDAEAADDWVIDVAELARRGRAALAADPGLVDARIDQVRADHVATIMYTSGTTGVPKGVLLPHSCWTYEAAAVQAADILRPDDLQYLWLPLSHVFGKVLLTLPMQIGFATAVDGRIDKIVDNLAVVHPTFMGAAPRIFEKAHARIDDVLRGGSPVKARLATWALGVGRQMADTLEAGRQPSRTLAARHALADKLVLHKIRARFGSRMRFMISGSAALNPDIARWFASCGLLIIEGYGLTESSAATCVNRPIPGAYAFGTIGWPLPGTEAKIAEDGELLIRGPGVMRGYHRHPDATAEAFDEDGFFRTGDIGEIDHRGFVRITDRKKDVFKTSGGKYVSPAQIETRFKGLCPLASQMLVHGDRRNFASALVTLDPDAIAAWASAHGKHGMAYEELAADPQVRAEIQAYVDQLNAGLNRWETIKKFVILDQDLTVENGDLTPSLKVKRRAVESRHQDEIDAMYAEGRP